MCVRYSALQVCYCIVLQRIFSWSVFIAFRLNKSVSSFVKLMYQFIENDKQTDFVLHISFSKVTKRNFSCYCFSFLLFSALCWPWYSMTCLGHNASQDVNICFLFQSDLISLLIFLNKTDFNVTKHTHGLLMVCW